MRGLRLKMSLAALLSGVALSGAAAAPAGFDPALRAEALPVIVPVQLVCDPRRCIDPRTGAYTQSGCNRRGCYPISGIVGYERSRGGAGRGYGRPRDYQEDDDYDYEPRRRRRYDPYAY